MNYSLLPLMVAVAAFAGCHGSRVEEAEHHAPAHKPADFPAAVDRLLTLHAEITNGDLRTNDPLDVFTETSDIVRWLPDLAADSDLGEEPWNSVYATSQRLETILNEVQSRRDADRYQEYQTYETEFDQLYNALLEIKQLFLAATELAADQTP
ncbi:MAG: hypothetical protein KatS3mg111_1869 [Pirellulaceae bacterium]|nr:MAG: hypothetical protein KatS3mg111_1869 [Pirellulaceae bacterium]